MPNPSISLFTLEYPPDVGGVARYLGNLVEASHGAIRVKDARAHFRRAWPRWWPLVGEMRRRAVSGERGIILVSHVFPVGTAARIARLSGGSKYGVFFHGLDIRLVRTPWKKWLLRRICSGATWLITNSEATKRDLLGIVPRAQVSVLTPGVEQHVLPSRAEARRRLGMDPEKPVVISVARLIPRKGLDIALRVMARVQTNIDADFVVIGDGPDLRRLEAVAEQSRTRVTWIRNADDEEKWKRLAAADVFLLPVRDEGADVEGFGIAYLEAAQAGVPGVAGKNGGAPEAVRHERTGLVVDPSSVDDVEDAVLKLLTDAGLRERLGAEARRRAQEDFRWEDRWDRLKDILGFQRP